MRSTLILLGLATVFSVACAHNSHIDEGDRHYERGNYEAAVTKYERAAYEDPGSDEARSKLDRARRRLLETLRERVRREISAQRFSNAIRHAEVAHTQLPQAQTTFEIIDELATALRPHSKSLVARRELERGMALWSEVRDRLPPLRQEAKSKHDEIKRDLLEGLASRAVEHEESGRTGEAYLQWAKTVEVSNTPYHVSQKARVHDKLMAEVEYRVFIEPTEGSIESEIARRLGKQSWHTMRFVDDVERAHATLTITTGEPEFTTFETDTVKKKRYQSGTKDVENPRHVDAAARVEEAEKKLAGLEEELARRETAVLKGQEKVTSPTANITSLALEIAASARKRDAAANQVESQRARLERLRGDLSKIPATVEEPVFSEFEYPVRRIARRADMKLETTLRHSDERPEITRQKLSYELSDDHGHPAHEKYEIPADPLNTPDDNQVMAKLMARSTKLTQESAIESFYDWRRSLLTRAEKAETDSVRIDLYVRYLAADPTRQVEPRVLEAIRQERSIDNPLGLFQH